MYNLAVLRWEQINKWMLSVGSRAGCLARPFCSWTTSFHVNDRRHKNRQSSWSELDFDMDIGALCVCSMHILYSVRIKGHIPNVDVCVCLCLIYLNVFVPSVIPLWRHPWVCGLLFRSFEVGIPTAVAILVFLRGRRPYMTRRWSSGGHPDWIWVKPDDMGLVLPKDL